MSQQAPSVVEKTLSSLQEQAAPPAPASSPPLTAEMLVAVMSAAMTAAVAPLMARLDRIEGGRQAALPTPAPRLCKILGHTAQADRLLQVFPRDLQVFSRPAPFPQTPPPWPDHIGGDAHDPRL